MNEPKPNAPSNGRTPAPLPNIEARANALREQEVLNLCMQVRTKIGTYYQEIIWAVIERDRMTREQIADALGVTDRAMRNWTQGHSAPRIHEQSVLMALDSGLLVIKLLPDRSGHPRPTLVPSVLAGGLPASASAGNSVGDMAGKNLSKG